MRSLAITLLLLIILAPGTAISKTAAYANVPSLIVMPDAGVKPLTDIIESAQKSIDLVLHRLNDERIQKTLKLAAKRGIKIRIMLEKYPKSLGNDRKGLEKRVRDSGAFLKWANPSFATTIQNTVSIDSSVAYISTFDFTKESIDIDRGFVVKILDPREVAEIKRIFEADWNRQRATPTSNRLAWAPDLFRTRVFRLIQGTKHSLSIYAVDISDKHTIRLIAAAIKRDVNVKVLVASKGWDASYPGIIELLKVGARIRSMKIPKLQANAILSDNGNGHGSALVGSVDLVKRSIDESRGLGFLVKNSAKLKILNETFEKDWAAAK